ncbi:MAG: hypothetical protein U9Q83_12345, partial [Bacteroidota bacterium]|nr:hypothetical protein [Bacteroidota bacterium]
MKKIILLLLIISPFISVAQIEGDSYSAIFTYKNDDVTARYINDESKSRISYKTFFVGEITDSINDNRDILLHVRFNLRDNRKYILERYKDTVFTIEFQNYNYGENVRKPIIYLYPT